MALAQHVTYIRQHTKDPTTPLGTYFDKQNQAKAIRSQAISETIKTAAREMQLERYGIPPHKVSSHSLRAGGAMALHLAGKPSHVIQKMGRWTSNTYLTYIHAQISCLSTGLSALMSFLHTFINVARPSAFSHPQTK